MTRVRCFNGGAFVMARVLTCTLICVGVVCNAALAADVSDMVGRWHWQQFTIEVAKCQEDRICAKVVEGPKNVGMEVFASQLADKDGNLVGQIVDPNTKETYNTRFQQEAADKWRLDGCTAARVCLSGEFLRVK